MLLRVRDAETRAEGDLREDMRDTLEVYKESNEYKQMLKGGREEIHLRFVKRVMNIHMLQEEHEEMHLRFIKKVMKIDRC